MLKRLPISSRRAPGAIASGKRKRGGLIAVVSIVVVGLVVAACGGGDPTAAPTNTPGSTPPSMVTSVPATATSVPATATSVAATATPEPARAYPTPVILGGGKVGGTLNLRAFFRPSTWDTYDARGRSAFFLVANLFNNLIWIDPYGDVDALVGDLASEWNVSEDGTTYTFSLQKGVKFHDGTAFTAEDVVYNFDRAWKPRSTTMTNMKNAFAPISSIEAPDDFTVKVTLSQPSHTFLAVLGSNRALMYPSSSPLPDVAEEFSKNPIGTGPYKWSSEDGPVIELVRNDNYWRDGLPYIDKIVFNVIRSNTTAIAGMRTGKFDLENFVGSAVEGVFNAEKGNPDHVFYFNLNTLNTIYLNVAIAPWTDIRVREAVSLSIDRQSLMSVWQEGRGSLTGPLIPPERGGEWGIPAAEMELRPGYRADKTEDLARAKELLEEAGVDPSEVTVRILEASSVSARGLVVDASLRRLGFKTDLQLLASGAKTELLLQGAFDIAMESFAPATDDPSDSTLPWVITDGSRNYGHWTSAPLNLLFDEQDKSVDPVARKQILREMQELILSEYVNIPGILRDGIGWHRSYVKDYPEALPFWFSNRYRYEQIWLDKS